MLFRSVIIRPLNTSDTISFLNLESNQSRLVTTNNFAIFNGSIETARFLTTGGFKLAQYGSGTFTGTAAYNLSVDSNGNIIETTAGGGGSSNWTLTGNNIYNNEPIDVFTGSGETITSFVESGDFDIEDGNAIMFMNRIIPDYDLSGGKIKMKFTTKQYPESTESITKEFDITNATQKVDFRSRGRQAKVRVSCDYHATSWRWGLLRLALQGDGRR